MDSKHISVGIFDTNIIILLAIRGIIELSFKLTFHQRFARNLGGERGKIHQYDSASRTKIGETEA